MIEKLSATNITTLAKSNQLPSTQASVELSGYSFENFISESSANLGLGFETTFSNLIYIELTVKNPSNYKTVGLYFVDSLSSTTVTLTSNDTGIAAAVDQAFNTPPINVFYPLTMYQSLKMELDNAFYTKRFNVVLNISLSFINSSAVFQFTPQ